jgi:hypothetical protein
MKSFMADFMGHIDNGRHHLALEIFRKHPGIIQFKDVKRSLVTAYNTYHKRWPKQVADELRREFRSFAKLYNEVGEKLRYKLMVISVYPDGQPIIWSVSNLARRNPAKNFVLMTGPDSEEQAAFEQNELENQESAVVICFEGPNAKVAAAQIQQRFEFFIRQDRPAKIKTWLRELGVTFKSVRVHDCQQHPLS